MMTVCDHMDILEYDARADGGFEEARAARKLEIENKIGNIEIICLQYIASRGDLALAEMWWRELCPANT